MIVKGYGGFHMTKTRAFFALMMIWFYSTFMSVMPFFGWGSYIVEGLMVFCGCDYYRHGWFKHPYMIFFMNGFCFNFMIPFFMMAYFYWKVKSLETFFLLVCAEFLRSFVNVL